MLGFAEGFAEQARYESRSLLKPDDEVAKRGTSIRLSHIIVGVGLPTLLFAFCFIVNQTKIRHTHKACWLFVAVFIPAAVNMWVFYLAYKQLKKRGKGSRWIMVLCLTLSGSQISANLLGDKTYWRYMRSYYDFQDLAAYVNIDPYKDKGQSYMDAGQVYFKEGSRVATQRAIAFRSSEIYCVAPIMRGEDTGTSADGEVEVSIGSKDSKLKMPPSGTIDFWAVGINCCDPSGLDPGEINFRCGETENLNARAGIRQLRDDTRAFFKMAVEAWSASLNMPVKHPLFFTWVSDPLYRVNECLKTAWNNLTKYTFNCAVIVTIVTVALHWMLFKMGF